MGKKFQPCQQWLPLVNTLKEIVLFRILITAVQFISALIISLIELILYFTIRPWSLRIYRKIDCYLASRLAYTTPVFLLQWWSNTKFELFADPSILENHLGKEPVLILPNHKYEMDWLFLFPIANYFGVLGSLRYFSKKTVQYIPMVGWSWKLHDNIFLERNWEKDKTHFTTQLNDLFVHGDPGILVLYSEGTRFTQTKHQASMNVAREKGLPELQHHLLPRTRGFVESMKVLRKPSIPPVAVYDALLVAVNTDDNQGLQPTLINILKGKRFNVKIFLRRYSIRDIPEDENKCANWLHERFQEKDKLMDNILKTGNFVAGDEKEGRKYEGFQSLEIPRQSFILVNFLFFVVLILAPLIGFMWKYALNNGIIHWTSVIIFSILAFGQLSISALEKRSSGSSYGLNK